jgi:hypothetical protein
MGPAARRRPDRVVVFGPRPVLLERFGSGIVAMVAGDYRPRTMTRRAAERRGEHHWPRSIPHPEGAPTPSRVSSGYDCARRLPRRRYNRIVLCWRRANEGRTGPESIPRGCVTEAGSRHPAEHDRIRYGNYTTCCGAARGQGRRQLRLRPTISAESAAAARPRETVTGNAPQTIGERAPKVPGSSSTPHRCSLRYQPAGLRGPQTRRRSTTSATQGESGARSAPAT